jgi:uncharacterized spore protein YtfJ
MTNDLNSLLGDIMSRLKTMVDADTVIGKPIPAGGCSVLPVSKLSFGFVTGGADKKTEEKKEAASLPDSLALIGGGMTVTPLGFLVVGEGDIYYIKTQGDNVNKWLEIIQSTIRNVRKS